jgi:hypothetical protein
MRLFLTLGFTCLIAMPSQGAVIITNLGTATGGGFTVDNGFEGAAGFTMPAGTSYNLTSATVTLDTIGFRSITGNNIDIRLFGSSGGNPVGPPLVAFTHPADFSGNGIIPNITVTPVTPFTLQPSVTYWLTVRDTVDNGALAWANSSTAPTGIATSAGTRQQQASPPQTFIGCCAVYQIDATAVAAGVPEPSTVGLGMLGLCALLFAKRRVNVSR